MVSPLRSLEALLKRKLQRYPMIMAEKIKIGSRKAQWIPVKNFT